MASVTLTVASGGEAGAQFRQLAKAIEKASAQVPDRVTGASTVLTIDNAAGSLCSVAVTGPYAGTTVYV